MSRIHAELLNHFCRAEHIKFKCNFDEKLTLSKYLTLILAKVSFFCLSSAAVLGIKPRALCNAGQTPYCQATHTLALL